MICFLYALHFQFMTISGRWIAIFWLQFYLYAYTHRHGFATLSPFPFHTLTSLKINLYR